MGQFGADWGNRVNEDLLGGIALKHEAHQGHEVMDLEQVGE
jgi:hypothetical protein